MLSLRRSLAVFSVAISSIAVASAVASASASASAVAPSATSVLATATLSLQNTSPPSRKGYSVPREYDPATIDYRTGSTLSASEVNVHLATAMQFEVDLDLRTAGGKPFAIGTYSGFGPAAAQPDLQLSTGSDGCFDNGQFTVHDVGYVAGALTRLDVTFINYCDYGPFAVFGELTLGEPNTPVVAEQRRVNWPLTAVGILSGRAPIVVRNTTSQAISIGRPAVTGARPADFPILANNCRSSLAPAATCLITPAFAPSVSGTETATLSLPTGAGTLQVPLQGSAPTGRTGLVANSTGGDLIGAGQTWKVSDQSTFWQLISSPTGFTAASGEWRIDFGVYPGHVLAVGSYPHAGTGAGATAGLNVSAHHRGCSQSIGSVTIKSLSYTSGAISTLDFVFTQSCADKPGSALHGEFFWRTPGSSDPPVASTQLTAGTQLLAGRQISQPDTEDDGSYLSLSTTGNLTITDGQYETLFSTGTTGSHNTFTLTTQGNLEVHSSTGKVLWSSKSNAGPGCVATFQADDVLVLRNQAHHVVWSSALSL